MNTPLVPIIMGSESDLEHAKKIAGKLEEFGIEYDLRVGSAHKVAHYLLEVLRAMGKWPTKSLHYHRWTIERAQA